MSVLAEWKLSAEELDEIISANPSLRGFLFGYVAEYKLRKMWFSDRHISNLVKYDNHDRTRKGDISFYYKGVEISVEVKSLQTSSIRRIGDEYRGRFQCDASDRRLVRLPNGDEIETTCLVVGAFDLVAVTLFAFEKEWRFAFAKNADLPHTRARKYTLEQKQYLLATLMEATWPLKPPFEPEPFRLLDEIVQEKSQGSR